MSGTTVMSGMSFDSVGPKWQLAGVVDVNGDGYADLVWQHTMSDIISVWYMVGSRMISYDAAAGPSASVWQLVR